MPGLQPTYAGFPWALEQGTTPRGSAYPQGLDDIASLAAALGDKEWILGDKPSTLDALAYSVLANILRGPPPVPLKRAIESTPNLCAFCDRVEERYLKGIELD